MGMNYYLRQKPCEKCGHTREELHIGKSSCGWRFHFRAYPLGGISTYQDWLKEFENPNKEIINEDGQLITIEGFKQMVESKKIGLNHYNIFYNTPETDEEVQYLKDRVMTDMSAFYKDHEWKDPEGHPFTFWEFC